MLKIAHLTPFAFGGHRCCFVHPHDPTKCVKTLRPHCRPEDLRKKAVWYKRYLRPLARFDYNRREFAEIQRLAKTGDPLVWWHVARHFGFVETDLGTAAVVELIRKPDGTPATTLADLIRRDELPQQALDEFRRFLHSVMPFWPDSRPLNVVLAPPPPSQPKCPATGGRLVIVDGLIRPGSRILKSRIPAVHHRIVHRYYAKFEETLAACMEDEPIDPDPSR